MYGKWFVNVTQVQYLASECNFLFGELDASNLHMKVSSWMLLTLLLSGFELGLIKNRVILYVAI